MGEFNKDERIAQLVAEYIPKGPGIVFVRTRKHAASLSAKLSVPYITSKVGKSDRKQIADGLRSGKLKTVVATAAWATGVNIPSLRWVILPERVKAPIAILQSAGRALRQAAGKPGYEIINLVDGSTPEGLRYGAEREASLASVGFRITSDEMRLDELLATPAAPAVAAPRGNQRRQAASAPGHRVGAACVEARPWPVAHKIVLIGLVVLLLSILDRCILSWQIYP